MEKSPSRKALSGNLRIQYLKSSKEFETQTLEFFYRSSKDSLKLSRIDDFLKIKDALNIIRLLEPNIFSKVKRLWKHVKNSTFKNDINSNFLRN